MDRYGEHALTCNRVPVALRRHNAVCAAVRRCTDRANLRPTMETKSVIDRGGVRPADVYLERWPGKHGGMAVDVTIISRWTGLGIRDAEERKRRKYADYLANTPNLGFCPFALDLNGGVGDEAWKAMVTWARSIAAEPSQLTDLDSALRGVVGEIAWTFVDEVTRQIRGAADPRRHRSYC